jgi:hypothetical protein
MLLSTARPLAAESKLSAQTDRVFVCLDVSLGYLADLRPGDPATQKFLDAWQQVRNAINDAVDKSQYHGDIELVAFSSDAQRPQTIPAGDFHHWDAETVVGCLRDLLMAFRRNPEGQHWALDFSGLPSGSRSEVRFELRSTSFGTLSRIISGEMVAHRLSDGVVQQAAVFILTDGEPSDSGERCMRQPAPDEKPFAGRVIVRDSQGRPVALLKVLALITRHTAPCPGTGDDAPANRKERWWKTCGLSYIDATLETSKDIRLAAANQLKPALLPERIQRPARFTSPYIKLPEGWADAAWKPRQETWIKP